MASLVDGGKGSERNRSRSRSRSKSPVPRVETGENEQHASLDNDDSHDDVNVSVVNAGGSNSTRREWFSDSNKRRRKAKGRDATNKVYEYLKSPVVLAVPECEVGEPVVERFLATVKMWRIQKDITHNYKEEMYATLLTRGFVNHLTPQHKDPMPIPDTNPMYNRDVFLTLCERWGVVEIEVPIPHTTTSPGPSRRQPVVRHLYAVLCVDREACCVLTATQHTLFHFLTKRERTELLTMDLTEEDMCDADCSLYGLSYTKIPRVRALNDEFMYKFGEAAVLYYDTLN